MFRRSSNIGYTDIFQYIDTTEFGASDTATIVVTVTAAPPLVCVLDTAIIGPNDTLFIDPFLVDSISDPIIGGVQEYSC